MSEQKNYPQLPKPIWWGFREILISKPSVQLTPKMLAVRFEVQETAAKAYLRELQKIGMVDEDGKPSELALKWRIDETYSDAVQGILSHAYPDELLQTLDTKSVDREKAKQWFMLDGLGSGSANNKAATFAMIASPEPGEPLTTNQKQEKATPTIASAKPKTKPNDAHISAQKEDSSISSSKEIPLNVNVQIHISADASNEQIEKIFQSMRKYLY
ncbi:hypothetical protein GQ651_13125 [Alphaproteobacteria bacterium GH1-50]|uniref:Uncharacterized protein n=1 Tax=Kangsaoukella pontilimi TaxID=2691042 RepID=A0A7C9MBM0_9RHOB|nr:DUF5343 domain-containing protein [Kangsaoukella pontilimi]MXQ08793.1 hypothetical protein [Kangsaoukella pontilimi]